MEPEVCTKEQALKMLNDLKQEALEKGATRIMRDLKRKIRDVEQLPDGADRILVESLRRCEESVIGLHTGEEQVDMAVRLLQKCEGKFILIVKSPQGKLDTLMTGFNKIETIFQLLMAAEKISKVG